MQGMRCMCMFLLFKQKTAYERRISDWSSDVCSSDLAMLKAGGGAIVNTASSLGQVAIPGASEYVAAKHGVVGLTRAAGADYGARGIRVNAEIGRASCRERGCQYVSISVAAV